MNVLISGAGIAGPVLAYFLSKTGAKITVLERNPSFLSQGQNIDLGGTAITVAKKMGVMDDIIRCSTGEEGMEFISPGGRSFAWLPVDGPSGTAANEILRGDLARILYEATKGDPNITYLFGTTVASVLSNDDTGVTLSFNTGETRTFDVAVAADGQWSHFRRLVFPASNLTVVDKGMYAGFWTIPREASDKPRWSTYHATRSRLLITRPDPHGTMRAMAVIMPTPAAKESWQHAARHGDRAERKDLVRRDFADAGWQAERLLKGMEAAEDFYLQAVQQIRLNTWSHNRIVCVGDAAYAPTPLTGMGTSLAVIGAYCLAGELSKLQPGEHPARAFDAYEAVFKPYVQKIQELPSYVPRIFAPEGVVGRWILQTGLAVFAALLKVPGVKWWLQGEDDPEDLKDGFVLPEYEWDVKGKV